MTIELRAQELLAAHYASRPHIKPDATSLEFYRRIAEMEADKQAPDHETLRREYGGSFE